MNLASCAVLACPARPQKSRGRPEDLVGRQVVVVANLSPRKMVGLESRGMLLMATDRAGKLVPLVAASEPGSTVS